MGNLDGVTWQALGLVLTVVGLVLSVVVWRRRGPARGLRAVAWSLLPLAAGLTGVLRLVGEIAEAVLRWATRLAFSPVVWVGLLVAAVAVVLFVASGFLLRRGEPPPSKPVRGKARQREALPSSATPPERATGTRGAGSAGSTGTTGTPGDDLAEIEEILRKHGIQ